MRISDGPGNIRLPPAVSLFVLVLSLVSTLISVFYIRRADPDARIFLILGMGFGILGVSMALLSARNRSQYVRWSTSLAEEWTSKAETHPRRIVEEYADRLDDFEDELEDLRAHRAANVVFDARLRLLAELDYRSKASDG